MKVAIIDADLIGRKRHRFPNLVCMKISGYHKKNGDTVELKTNYNNLHNYDKVYISKVFTDTPIDDCVLKLSNVVYGGTGFYFDRAPQLPYEIEHHMPDYHLYDNWIEDNMVNCDSKKNEYKEYLDYSIGFLTRGCFRKCGFCVNQKYNQVFDHSPLNEFYDKSRKKICLLDDNFLGCKNWKNLLQQLIDTGKPFKFKQGLDERLLTDEKCKMLFNSKYDGAITFAFDDIDDYQIIENKLKMIRKHTNKIPMFYVLVGYDKNNIYDNNFWIKDIEDTFKRIELLMKYKCLPYIMRFKEYNNSPYRGMYIAIAGWCNQPSFFKKKTLLEFGEMKGNSSRGKYIKEFLEKNKNFNKYCNMRFEEVNEY